MKNLKLKLQNLLYSIWDSIRLPFMLVLLFWFSGIGFYHGVIIASDIGKLSMGKVIVVSVLDISKSEEEEEHEQ